MKKKDVIEQYVAEKNDVLIVSLRLESGRFESTVRVPLFAKYEDKQEFVDRWLLLMESVLKCGSRKNATGGEDESAAQGEDDS